MRLVFVYCLILISLCSCSPTYVIRAGWEEAKILWGREEISELLEEDDLDPKLREQLILVSDVRSFAKSQHLKPGGSYGDYADIGRDKLVWVLSAADKRSLRPASWWFPIVGSVPYKGFFDKEDALKNASDLKEDGFDTYVRHSPAFSTLGWFDDPLLNTMLGADNISLTNTVIHEILHSTIWISDSAVFNESLANFVGGVGAIQYYQDKDAKLASVAKDRLHDEITYSRFLATVIPELEEFYSRNKQLSDEELLTKRGQFFESLADKWNQLPKKNPNFRLHASKLNNAVLLSQVVYYARLEDFCRFFYAGGGSLAQFIPRLEELKQLSETNSSDPFDELSSFLVDSGGNCEILD